MCSYDTIDALVNEHDYKITPKCAPTGSFKGYHRMPLHVGFAVDFISVKVAFFVSSLLPVSLLVHLALFTRPTFDIKKFASRSSIIDIPTLLIQYPYEELF